MPQRFDDGAHFVTFSCYKRRRLLDRARARRIVLGVLSSELGKRPGAACLGFCSMPDHVHAMIWFPTDGQISSFMQVWKKRSSVEIKKLLSALPAYSSHWNAAEEPVWQRRFYDFNVYSKSKINEKLEYMHQNPVRAGLVSDACDWPFSSARFYLQGKSVGVAIAIP
jgi:putative transposase